MVTVLMGLIFLLWFILLRKTKRGIPLTTEERILAWLILIFTIATFFLQWLQYSDTKPSFLIPYLAYIVFSFAVLSGFLVLLLVVPRLNKKISKILAKRYRENLYRMIKKELESVAITEKLTFSGQPKNNVISTLAKRVSSDIMDVSAIVDYSVQPMNDRIGGVEVDLGGDILAIPFSEAAILAHKMTELRKNPKYRGKNRWLYLFWLR